MDAWTDGQTKRSTKATHRFASEVKYLSYYASGPTDGPTDGCIEISERDGRADERLDGIKSNKTSKPEKVTDN